VSDRNMCIRKVDVDNSRNQYQWPVDDEPGAMSLTGKQTLMVVCSSARKVHEYSHDGQRMVTICMGNDITPHHMIQISGEEFLSCSSDGDENPHIELGRSAVENIFRFLGKKGNGEGKLSIPKHMVVDKAGFVYVADANRRQKWTDSSAVYRSLKYIKEVLPIEASWEPGRLYLRNEVLFAGQNNIPQWLGNIRESCCCQCVKDLVMLVGRRVCVFLRAFV